MDATALHLAKTALIAAALLGLSACAQVSAAPRANEVAAAFESSNSLMVKPYTRTIFSSNDF